MSAKRANFKSKLGAARGFVRGAAPGFRQIAAVVRGMGVRGETKSLDIPLGALPFALGNTTSSTLCSTQEGAGFWNRIGRKQANKTLQIQGNITSTLAAGARLTEICRYIIFYDKQPNGVAATWFQVVQAYDNAGAVTNSVYDGTNMDNRDRFVILRDRRTAMPATGLGGIPTGPPYGTSQASVGVNTSGSDGGAIIKEYIKLNNLETQYNGTANPATVAQISTGNIGIVLQGNVGTQWTMELATRLRFTDC